MESRRSSFVSAGRGLSAALVILGCVLALLILVPQGTARAAAPAAATSWPCAGDGMTKECTRCLIDGDRERRCAQFAGAVSHARSQAFGDSPARYVLRGDGEVWKVAPSDFEAWQRNDEAHREAQRQERQRAAEGVTVTTPTPGVGTTTPSVAPSVPSAPSGRLWAAGQASVSSAAPVTASGLPWGLLGVLAAMLLGLVAVLRLRPAWVSTGRAWATRSGSAAAPYARAAGRGLRRCGPALAWLLTPSCAATGWARVVLVCGVLIAWMMWMPFEVGVAVLAVGLVLLGGGVKVRRDDPRWWAHTRLMAALVTSGAVPATVDGQRATLRYLGAPVVDERGTAVVVALPGAAVVSDLTRRHERIAAALGVPTERLRIGGVADRPANVARLWAGSGRPVVAPPVTLPEVTRWRDPVRIGTTSTGTPVTLRLHEESTLVGGLPGRGKTSLARLIAAHAMLDPEVGLYIIDAKGGRDWNAARPVASAFVHGADDGDVREALDLLRHLLALVRQRNAEGGPPLGLVVVDEPQEMRAAASKKQREEIDDLLARLPRLGRAAGLHVLLATQRPTGEGIPTSVRAVVSQRVALATRSEAEAAYILGHAPTGPLPRERGEAIVATTTEADQAVVLTHLGDAGWAEVTARAPRREPLDLSPEAPEVDPLLAAVADALRSCEGGEATPATVFDALPESIRPATPSALGKSLGALGVPSRSSGKRRVYRLADVEGRDDAEGAS